MTPEQLAQFQLDAYNSKNLDAFLTAYSEDVTVMDFPSNEVQITGIDSFANRYKKLFQENPNLHAHLKNRTIKENFVIDHEQITGRSDGRKFEAIAIYEIVDEKIKNVWFIR